MSDPVDTGRRWVKRAADPSLILALLVRDIDYPTAFVVILSLSGKFCSSIVNYTSNYFFHILSKFVFSRIQLFNTPFPKLLRASLNKLVLGRPVFDVELSCGL